MQKPKPLKIESLGEVTQNILNEIKGRKDGDSYRYSTGLRDLDNVIISIRKKRLYVVGGRSGIGKTSLMTNIAFNLADKHPRVFFFSLEMSKEEIVQRFICKATGVKYGMFELDTLTAELEQGLDSFNKLVKDYKMVVVDGIGYQFKELSTIIESLDPKPDVIFIDHIQMSSSVGYKSKYEAMSEYIRKLKELAVTQDMAVIVASQINRTAGEDRPKITQLKESGAIEEVSDVVLLCHWPYMSGASDDVNEYYILVGKNRFGRTKSQKGVRVCFQPATYNFKDYDPNEKYVRVKQYQGERGAPRKS